ncbi:UNVERIFIED_CONTAM: PHD finger protein EHD3 [Sesamum angustifolium]|uniref:PHD finger protein EHD3 n=1 Tax=Sesamum angustifolium TaxID=2727405 RepID=A0AAW2L5D4_9LAMI
MVDEQKESSVLVGGSYTESGVVEPKVDGVKVNGRATGVETGSPELGGSLLTYQRRRNAKVVENGILRDDAGIQHFEKSVKNSLNQASQKRSHALAFASSECSLQHQRNIVLEQLCQSLEGQGGLKRCIQDALAFDLGSCSRTTAKESVYSCEGGSKCTLETGSVRNGLQNAAKDSVGMAYSGSVNESDSDTFTEICRSTFFDVIMSERFAQLCSLLLENGMHADKLFDMRHINSRMKEKAYENSPLLFHSDIQQIWTKLQKVGADMIAIAKRLSDKTMMSFREQVGSSAHSISEVGRHEGVDVEEEIGNCSMLLPHLLHQEIENPVRGTECPHENCIACERLNASRSRLDGNGEDELASEEAPEELEESSNELVANGGDKRFTHCKVCRTEVRNDEDYRICGHSFCPHKFYHVKCLTSKQLISHGPCWYCPSCLCRACLIDRDDDKIVLCDGCDHAYHIYCMQPPRTAIPRGKWFCTKCDAGIQRVRKAKLLYENIQNKSRKRSLDGKLKTEEALNKSGGVDMLLNAAKTLNYEENLAAMRLKAT